MRSFIFSLFFLLIIYGCSSPKGSDSVSTIILNNSEITVSFLDKLKTDTTVIPLSSLVEECKLVQLEYDTENSFFKPWKTTITEKYIGIMQENASYKLFSRLGKFLCNVGSVGQGLGEYFIICDDIIDEKNELIYLAPFIDDKIYVYNVSGSFLKSIKMPQSMISPRIFLSNDTLTVAYIHNGNKSLITQINIHTGHILNEFPTQIPQIGKDVIYNSRNMRNIFDIEHAAHDTIYHIDISNHSIAPVFTMSDKSSEEMVKLHNQLNEHLVLSTIHRRGFVSKEMKGAVLTDIKNKKASWVKVKNDYFGNLDVPVSISNFNFYNGYYVHNIQPEQLVEDIEQRLTENNCTKKDKQILQKTLLALKESKNNVVFIGKLKNK